MFEEAVERFHQLDDSDIWAGVDELMIGVGGIGPAPRIGESVELRLAYLSTRLAKENVVIGVRVKGRIEIDKIDTRVRKLFPIGKPFQVVTKIKPIHPAGTFIARSAFALLAAREDDLLQRIGNKKQR